MLDNLFVGIAGDEVMTAAEGDGVTVQNCEVGWVGDIVAVYNTGEAATGYGGGIQRLAGAIGGGNHGTRYRNNYVHHMYHAGGGIEIFEEQGFESRPSQNLTGFDAAIHAVFPQTEIKNCIIHQLRNSSKYVSYKDMKALMADLKAVYTAVDEQAPLELWTPLGSTGIKNTRKSPSHGDPTGQISAPTSSTPRRYGA